MNTQEFRSALKKAEEGCRVLDTAYPGDRMIQSILAQLHFIKKWEDAGANWADEKLRGLNFGLLASKTVDAENRQLAELLYELANYMDENRRA